MKTGKTLQELAAEVQRQQESKRDFVVDHRKVYVAASDGDKRIFVQNGQDASFPINDNAHQQLGARLDIPKAYYDRIKNDVPDLWQGTVNRLITHKGGSHMIRTLDGTARAVMSNRYRRLDNAPLMQAILPTLGEVGGLSFESMEITQRKLYIKVVNPRMEGQVKVGDPVQSGILIANSEVGGGKIKVVPFIKRLICLNGCVVDSMGQSKAHLGRNIDVDDYAESDFSDEALQADDRAFWLKIRDLVRAALTDQTTFQAIIGAFQQAAGDPITLPPMETVELAQKALALSQEEGASVLHHLLVGGDLSRYGLGNAITRAAADVVDYDRATELEAVGGKLLISRPEQWKMLSAAA